MADDDGETLQELFRERQKALCVLTIREVWQRCRDRVSYETFRLIERGDRTRIGEDTVEALALALDVPASRVLAAAGQRLRRTRFVAPPRWDGLTPAERDVLFKLVDILLSARGETTLPEVDLRVAGEQTGPRRVRRAARRRPPDDQA